MKLCCAMINKILSVICLFFVISTLHASSRSLVRTVCNAIFNVSRRNLSDTKFDKDLINAVLLKQLIASQFPEFEGLSIQPVLPGGWDNRTFRLGKNMMVRMPSAEKYAGQVEKEFFWLPQIAPRVPLQIPEPLKIGEPMAGYPWKWAIYRWIEGSVATPNFACSDDFAMSLAQFLTCFQMIDSKDGPPPGPHNFYRGSNLKTYDFETRQALLTLQDRIDSSLAINIWERALERPWQHPPMWFHGDVSRGNLLVQNGRLNAVIDFGMMGVGDPACDLTIAWTLFRKDSRSVFRRNLLLDDDTWERGRAWALWKASIVMANMTDTNRIEAKQSRYVMDEILDDYKRH